MVIPNMEGKNMLRAKLASSLVIILSFGFILLALPEEGFSGFSTEISCCQGEGFCTDSSEGPFLCIADNVVEDAFCNQNTGICTPVARFSSIPTMSEWGLIAMAGILAIAGLIIIRRKKAAA